MMAFEGGLWECRLLVSEVVVGRRRTAGWEREREERRRRGRRTRAEEEVKGRRAVDFRSSVPGSQISVSGRSSLRSGSNRG